MEFPESPTPPRDAPKRSALQAVLLTLGLSVVIVALSVKFMPGKAKAAVPGASVPLKATMGPAEIIAALPPPDPATDLGKALAKTLSGLKAGPDDAVAWTTLGDLLAQTQRDTLDPQFFEHAGRAYQTALKLKPAHTAAMAGMAWVFGGRHQFDLSILWAEKALAVDPDNIACQGILGDAAVETGDYDKAFDHYQKMMDLRPDLSSWSRGAYLLWLTGKQNRATLLMEQAIRSGGPFAENTAWCRARLAMMYFHDGTLPSAIGALQPVLNANTVNPHVLLAAGRISAGLGNYPAAADYYQKVNARRPSIEALAGLGDLQAIQGNAAAAEEYYAKVESLHLMHRETGVHDHMEIARFYADHDRNVAEGLRLALEHGQTGNPFEADTFAWLYFKNGNQPKAIEWIKRALKASIPDASLHYHAACIASAAGDRVSTGKHLQLAISKNPHFSLLLAKDAFKRLEDLGNNTPVTEGTPAPAPVPASAAGEAPVPSALTNLR